MNACAMWDFRCSYNNVSGTLEHTSIIAQMDLIAKAYSFQLEKGDNTGYMHYQGRFSLIKKHRKVELMKLFTEMPVPNYLEPTVNANSLKGDMFYVTKNETRVDGPWTDSNRDKYIPKQYLGMVDRLYPYQEVIFNSYKMPINRYINLIYDPIGNKGKSVIAGVCELYSKGICLPPINDAEKIVYTLCNICTSKKLRDPNPVIIDMPRAMDKSKLDNIYNAIEQIKNGKLYDLRNSYKEWWIDSPQIWVFSNIEPDTDLLSADRWKLWEIDSDFSLKKLRKSKI